MGKGMEVGNYDLSKDDNNNGPRKKITAHKVLSLCWVLLSMTPQGLFVKHFYHKNPTFQQLFLIGSF